MFELTDEIVAREWGLVRLTPPREMELPDEDGAVWVMHAIYRGCPLGALDGGMPLRMGWPATASIGEVTEETKGAWAQKQEPILRRLFEHWFRGMYEWWCNVERRSEEETHDDQR